MNRMFKRIDLLSFLFVMISLIILVFEVVDSVKFIRGAFIYDLEDYDIVNGEVIHSKKWTKSVYRNSTSAYEIIYVYRLDGKVFESNIINFLDDDTDLQYLTKYPVGKQVDVYYLKTNRKFSALEPSVKSFWVLKKASFWAVLFFISLLFFYYRTKEKRTE